MLNHNKPKETESKAGQLIFDCYLGEAGLPVQPGYQEITLTTTDDPDKLQMDVYFRPTGDGETETKWTYLVSSQALDDAMMLVRKYEMEKWNESDYPCLCGVNYVCKFEHEGKFIRVSTDHMPVDADSRDAFSEIYSALSAYTDPSLQI